MCHAVHAYKHIKIRTICLFPNGILRMKRAQLALPICLFFFLFRSAFCKHFDCGRCVCSCSCYMGSYIHFGDQHPFVVFVFLFCFYLVYFCSYTFDHRFNVSILWLICKHSRIACILFLFFVFFVFHCAYMHFDIVSFERFARLLAYCFTVFALRWQIVRDILERQRWMGFCTSTHNAIGNIFVVFMVRVPTCGQPLCLKFTVSATTMRQHNNKNTYSAEILSVNIVNQR